VPKIKSGVKARDTNKSKYGEDFYAKIGAMGGKISKNGGFHYMKIHDPERFSSVSSVGGKISKRSK
jgi:uncharacterized protein